jgi:prefoldin subunit 5
MRTQVLIEHEYRIRKELAEIEANRRSLETKLDTNLKQRQRIDPEAEELIQELIIMERSRCHPLCDGNW